jgi:hypothetical protein
MIVDDQGADHGRAPRNPASTPRRGRRLHSG